MRPKLIIMRGISGSGKSTLVAPYQKYVLSSDKLREIVCNDVTEQRYNKQVFDTLRSLLEHRMKLGVNTIIDATSLKFRDVSKYIEIAERYGIRAYVFSINANVEDCIKAVDKRAAEGGLRVPEEAIRNQYEKYLNNTSVFRQKMRMRFFEFDLSQAKSSLSQLFDTSIPVSQHDNIWLIGDVHACHEELEELLSKCKEEMDAPVLLLGDFIDRGPSLEKTLTVMRKHNVSTLLGNHERKFYLEQKGDECRSNARAETHSQYDNLSTKLKEYMDMLLSCSAYCIKLVNIVGKEVYVSHAGIKSKEPKSISECCQNSGYVDTSFKQVYGHRSWEYTDMKSEIKTNAVCIDSGCYQGNCLTAYNPFTDQYIQVKAKKVYYNYD